MLRRILTVALLALGVLVANTTIASANDGSGIFGGSHASASAGHRKVTVTAGITHHRPSGPTSTQPTPTTDPPFADPPPTYTCTSGPIELLGVQELLGVGGPQPGYWAITECTGPGAPPPSRPFWVTEPSPTPPSAATPAPSPATVAQQAAKTLHLASPTIEMAPPENTEQLVGVQAWLWVNPAEWQPESVSATVDGVTASATATPEEVIWNMGDGHSVTCHGPGTPYEASNSNATTDCSYTWMTPSTSQPSSTYRVTATIEFAVAWNAAGAAGGGNLGVVPGATSEADVTVGESEALNTSGTA
jgi:hypothetical protein